ncbi:MAG: glucose-1-phosphate adenylyltransferase [Candidatus Competibacterales bacterium]
MNVNSARNVSRLTQQTLALVLAGGRGRALGCLTRQRPDAALYFAGKFRLIDFPLSNCVNTDIRRIGVLTHYRAQSLLRHLFKGWNFLDADRDEFIDVLPASHFDDDQGYRGTADAVYKNLDYIANHNPELVLILAADHVYKMDYGPLLAQHVECKADLTIACVEVDSAQAAGRLGVMTTDGTGRVSGFVEKPVPGDPALKTSKVLASMGIYAFSRDFLEAALAVDASAPHSSRDFGRDVIPRAIAGAKVFAYPFRDIRGHQPYWRDIGNVDAYYRANMELTAVTPELDLYDRNWPILTHQLQLPPARFIGDQPNQMGMASDSLVSAGCIIDGAEVQHSLLFSNVRVAQEALVEASVVLPDVTIGRGCRIRGAVVERGVSLADHTVVGEDPNADKERFEVTSNGIVLVCNGP